MKINIHSKTDGHPIIGGSILWVWSVHRFSFSVWSMAIARRLGDCSSRFERNGLMEKLVDCMCQLEEFSIDQPSSALRWAPYSRENVSLDLDRLIFPNLRVLSVKQEFKAKATIIAHRLEKLVLWEFSFTQARGLTCKSDFEWYCDSIRKDISCASK